MATAEQTALADELITEDKAELAKFRRQDQAIAELAKKYSGLKIAGINDTGGYKAVHAARMVVRDTRVGIDKRRKELKAEALAFGRMVESEADRLFALIEPIESHLLAEEKAVDDEKDRLKAIEQQARQEALQARLDALTAVGCLANPILVGAETEAAFQARLAKATAEHAERLRIDQEAADAKRKADEEAAAERAKQEAALKAERERLDAQRVKQEQEAAAERERLAAIQRKQDEDAAALRAEREKLQREESERKRLADLEAAKIKAAEQARIDTERRIAEQAAADKAKAEAAEAARLKSESERPYREQLQALADKVLVHEVPKGPMSEAVRGILRTASQRIRQIAENKLE